MANTNTFKNNINNETTVSTLRAGVEIVAVSTSVAVLTGKAIAAAWHTTSIGNAARNNDIIDTLSLEGETKTVMVDGIENMRNRIRSLNTTKVNEAV